VFIDHGNFSRNFLIQGSFHRCFHVCIDQVSFLRSFLINSELKVNDDANDDVGNYVGANIR
jgi:hypothetical protein